MLKRSACSLLALFIFITVRSQSIDSVLYTYNAYFPQEKIHLQTDKESYLPGETVWYKAYILADDLPTAVSTNLYVDLLDEDGKILQHKTMPVLFSTADSYFTLPDTSENRYTIRAYTTWMLNFDPAFIYYKNISIIKSKEAAGNEKEKTTVSLRFFAEGGNMMAGLYNYIAFKATFSNGLPYDIKGIVKDSKGEIIDSIESVHDGMGLIKFTPLAGENYVAEWKDNLGEYRRTPLPAPQLQGILLHTEQLNGDLYYLINKPSNADNLQTLKVVATMNQKPVYTVTIQTNTRKTFHEKFDTKTIPTGVLQLTVFDKNNQPLAERIVFINNNNYSFNTSMSITESSLKKRGKTKIEIEVPDTAGSNLSLAVYDADLEQEQTGCNIYTDLLFQGDLKGYVYNAAWYFSDDANAPVYLDLVMQTNGWRRYNWDKIIANQMPEIAYQRDSYLSIFGKATDDKQSPVSNHTVTLMLQTQDSTTQWYTPETVKDGTFTQPGLIFYNSTTVFYKALDVKTHIGIGIAKGFNGLSSVTIASVLPPYLSAVKSNTTTTSVNYTQTFITEIQNKNPGFEKNAKLLTGVVVKTNSKQNWKNDPMVKMDEKYTTGTFRGGGVTRNFDLLDDANAVNHQDIYNYLNGKIPGLTVQNSNIGKTLQVPNPNGFSGGFVEPMIFVDENLQDNAYLNSIPIEQIAYVKYFDNSYGRVAAAQQKIPTIAIYLKKDKDYAEALKRQPGSLTKISVAGYSPLKEFYSPDYSESNSNLARADLRTTLLWQPYILTNKANKKTIITFYNNDITTRLKVILEGMNEEGKLIHIEKIIE